VLRCLSLALLLPLSLSRPGLRLRLRLLPRLLLRSLSLLVRLSPFRPLSLSRLLSLSLSRSLSLSLSLLSSLSRPRLLLRLLRLRRSRSLSPLLLRLLLLLFVERPCGVLLLLLLRPLLAGLRLRLLCLLLRVRWPLSLLRLRWLPLRPLRPKGDLLLPRLLLWWSDAPSFVRCSLLLLRRRSSLSPRCLRLLGDLLRPRCSALLLSSSACCSLPTDRRCCSGPGWSSAFCSGDSERGGEVSASAAPLAASACAPSLSDAAALAFIWKPAGLRLPVLCLPLYTGRAAAQSAGGPGRRCACS
jgi:hypothetical protein